MQKTSETQQIPIAASASKDWSAQHKTGAKANYKYKQQSGAFIEPRGLRRPAAANYMGISPTHFDKLVEDGKLPRPKKLGRCTVWDRHQLDNAFDNLAEEDEDPENENPFDNIKIRSQN